MFRSLVKLAGPHVKLPIAPPGTGVIMHNVHKVKVFLDHTGFAIIYGSMFVSAYLGNRFYIHFIMHKNPLNPPRWAEEKAPEAHCHAPEDDD